VSRCAKRFSLSSKSVSPANRARSPALSSIPLQRPCSAPWGRTPGCASGSAWRTLAHSAIPAVEHCEEPSCVLACPTGAMARDPLTAVTRCQQVHRLLDVRDGCPFGGERRSVGKKALVRPLPGSLRQRWTGLRLGLPDQGPACLTPEGCLPGNGGRQLCSWVRRTCYARRGIVEIVKGRCLI
jgi:hypothetical protein